MIIKNYRPGINSENKPGGDRHNIQNNDIFKMKRVKNLQYKVGKTDEEEEKRKL